MARSYTSNGLLRIEALGEEDTGMTDGMIVDPRQLPVSASSVELRRLEGVGRQKNDAAVLLPRMQLDCVEQLAADPLAAKIL
jgi:hypothetical protein